MAIVMAVLAVPALTACVATGPAVAPTTSVSAAPSPSSAASPAPASPSAGPSASPQASDPALPDYSLAASWLAMPTSHAHKVDVFYLYPSAYAKPDASAPNICAADDPAMMQSAKVAFSRQATAFSPVADIYAPYYSQADATYALSLPPAQRDALIGGIPARDAIAAFDYYVRHLNHGRPFILASHSQGSQVMESLLSRYMKGHQTLYKRMIVAYVVGYSVTPGYLAQNPFLKFATGASDTGVIASWNTEAPTVDGTNPVLTPGGLVINPITWTRKETTVPAARNLGSIELNPATGGTPFLNPDGSIKKFMDIADATIDTEKGVVICSTIDASAPPYYTPGGFPMGVLHTFDYALYFFDVRANAANRIAHFLRTR
jgi:hypothetical protein